MLSTDMIVKELKNKDESDPGPIGDGWFNP